MKKIVSLLFAPIMVMMVMSISSCKKYDEGPAFSLNSKKSRVVNEWKVNKYTVNGKDVTSLIDGAVYDIKKDDTYVATLDGNVEDKGKWEFGNKKETVILISEDGSRLTWTIVKLKKDEFWAEYTEDGNFHEFQLVSN